MFGTTFSFSFTFVNSCFFVHDWKIWPSWLIHTCFYTVDKKHYGFYLITRLVCLCVCLCVFVIKIVTRWLDLPTWYYVLLVEWLVSWTSTQSTRVQSPVCPHDWFGCQYNRRSRVLGESSPGIVKDLIPVNGYGSVIPILVADCAATWRHLM